DTRHIPSQASDTREQEDDPRCPLCAAYGRVVLMSDATSGRKGSDLEETLKEYFWQAGYFAVRGVPYRLDDEDVTDVDVWLYERPAARARRRFTVAAKNKAEAQSEH